MKRLLSAVLIALACLALGGCATSAPQQGSRAASSAAVMEAVALGSSSKADVESRLGTAHAKVKFDSGYEVWAYQFAPASSLMDNIGAFFQQLQSSNAPPGMTEVVILFAPSGVATKIRLRLPPVPAKS
jgi:hypothetical protein